MSSSARLFCHSHHRGEEGGCALTKSLRLMVVHAWTLVSRAKPSPTGGRPICHTWYNSRVSQDGYLTGRMSYCSFWWVRDSHFIILFCLGSLIFFFPKIVPTDHSPCSGVIYQGRARGIHALYQSLPHAKSRLIYRRNGQRKHVILSSERNP